MTPAEEQSEQGTAIPPEVYDIAFGWDPGPEIERLLFCCHQCGVEPRSALELGCGTGRLLRCLQGRLADLTGLDLSPGMVEYTRARTDVTVVAADMSDFSFDRTFDLIYVSANTLRWITEAAAIRRMWRCVAAHLPVGGVFVADLELGLADEAAKLNRPATWTISRGQTVVRTTWTVIEPPCAATRCCTVEWVFTVQRGERRGRWREECLLRTYDAGEFLQLATADGRLAFRGFYLLRDPYLFETPVEKAVGRMLVVLSRIDD